MPRVLRPLSWLGPLGIINNWLIDDRQYGLLEWGWDRIQRHLESTVSIVADNTNFNVPLDHEHSGSMPRQYKLKTPMKSNWTNLSPNCVLTNAQMDLRAGEGSCPTSLPAQAPFVWGVNHITNYRYVRYFIRTRESDLLSSTEGIISRLEIGPSVTSVCEMLFIYSMQEFQGSEKNIKSLHWW